VMVQVFFHGASNGVEERCGNDTLESALAGHYYLKGAMETGSELFLKENGKFEWMLSYRNTDE